MERGSKRKAAAAALAASPTAETRASKRQKTPEVSKPPAPALGETPESTKEVGMRFMQQLRGATDKHGNLVATDFIALPPRKLYPDYYQEILLPLAIETIEGKLERREYPNMSAVESDMKRLVQNAKDFNENSSEIYQNAERIRKLVHNFMSKNNPAHKDKNYHAQPTPLPTQHIRLKTARPSHTPMDISEPDPAPDPPKAEPVAARRSRTKSQTEQPRRSASSPDDDGGIAVEEDDETSFEGKTFQQAQEQIVIELLEAKDPSGELKTFEPFANLPTRQLIDYYKVIKDPVSLKGTLKRVRGIHGRHENTGTTDFKSWDAFEHEVEKIWNNARTYNEDGSEVYETSIELEKYFLKRLAEAKKVVNEPPQPTLKLNMAKPAPIKLRLGSQKESPVPQSDQKAPTPGAPVDQSEAEKPNQGTTQPSSDAHASPKVDAGDQKATPRSPSATEQVQRKDSIAAESPATALPNGIKAEQKPSQSPAPASATAAPQSTTSSMAPPNRLPNGSPQPPPPPPPPQPQEPPVIYSQTGFDSKWRQDGKDANDALITNVSIITHPSLSLPKPFNTSVLPHPTLSQQSITLNLPPQHYVLQLSTTLASSLGPNRGYKLFVTANGQRMAPSISAAAQIANLGFTGGKRSFFDVKLLPGMNKLEIECVALSAPKSSSSPAAAAAAADPARSVTPVENGLSQPHPAAPVGQGQGLEMEKVTIFVHLLH